MKKQYIIGVLALMLVVGIPVGQMSYKKSMSERFKSSLYIFCKQRDCVSELNLRHDACFETAVSYNWIPSKAFNNQYSFYFHKYAACVTDGAYEFPSIDVAN